tara:strand:- start:231 stop:374 length:144 start_codon:yes stop_codon:yes gene_type:complete
MDLTNLVQQFANVGLTIFCVVVGVILVNWLDRNVFNKTRRHDDDKWD